jgi:hypothetical protein
MMSSHTALLLAEARIADRLRPRVAGLPPDYDRAARKQATKRSRHIRGLLPTRVAKAAPLDASQATRSARASLQ